MSLNMLEYKFKLPERYVYNNNIKREMECIWQPCTKLKARRNHRSNIYFPKKVNVGGEGLIGKSTVDKALPIAQETRPLHVECCHAVLGLFLYIYKIPSLEQVSCKGLRQGLLAICSSGTSCT